MIDLIISGLVFCLKAQDFGLQKYDNYIGSMSWAEKPFTRFNWASNFAILTESSDNVRATLLPLNWLRQLDNDLVVIPSRSATSLTEYPRSNEFN